MLFATETEIEVEFVGWNPPSEAWGIGILAVFAVALVIRLLRGKVPAERVPGDTAGAAAKISAAIDRGTAPPAPVTSNLKEEPPVMPSTPSQRPHRRLKKREEVLDVEVRFGGSNEAVRPAILVDRVEDGLVLLVETARPLPDGYQFHIRPPGVPDAALWFGLEVRACSLREGVFLLGCRFTAPLSDEALALFGIEWESEETEPQEGNHVHPETTHSPECAGTT